MYFTTTLLISLICGVILCYFGYRAFRVAMAAGGFAIGAGIGYLAYLFLRDELTGVSETTALLVFCGVGGILLAILSFRIYKAALFYVTLFGVFALALRTYLLIRFPEMGVMQFVLTLIGKGALLPDAAPRDTMWTAVGVCFAIGLAAALMAVLLQKPAVILATAAVGGMLLTQASCSLIGMNADVFTADSLEQIAGGKVLMPAIPMLIGLILIASGVLVQFKTAKKTN